MSRSSNALLIAALAILALLIALPSPTKRIDRDTTTPMDYTPPKGYVCYRANSPLIIDGKLDDAAWNDAPWSDLFQDIEGNAKPFPKLRTRMKMLWDDRYLYIAAEIEEPHVWGTLTQHDSVIFRDNDFEVFLDPDGDNHNYAELEMNALNTTWDLFLPKPYRDHGPALHHWEIHGLKTGVSIDGTLNDPSDRDRGWSLEIAWPMANIKEFTRKLLPPKEGDCWRINFSRVEWELTVRDGKYAKVPKKPEANWVWSPQGAIDMHRPEHWGYLQFTRQPPGSVTFVADPTGPAREALHRVYYAQHAFRKQHGHWARSLRELNLSLHHPSFVNLWLATTPGNFEASVVVPRGDGEPTTLRISADSRIQVEPSDSGADRGNQEGNATQP